MSDPEPLPSAATVPPPGRWESDQAARLKAKFPDWVIYGGAGGVVALRGEEKISGSPGLARCKLTADRDEAVIAAHTRRPA